MSLPSVQETRQRIEAIPNLDIKRMVQTILLFGLRVGEACGLAYESDFKAQPTGALLWASQSSWSPDETNDEELAILKRIIMRNTGKIPTEMDLIQIQEPAFVLSIITEKRTGFNRKAAIPLNPVFEPWSKEVFQYIRKRQDKGPLPIIQELALENNTSLIEFARNNLDVINKIIKNNPPVFPYYRQKIYRATRKAFEGLTYPIVNYKRRTEVDEGKIIYEIIYEHQKRCSDHFLRHLRATELKSRFRIKGEILDTFMGWAKPRGGDVSAMQERYVTEPWREAGYFPRLLKKRRF